MKNNRREVEKKLPFVGEGNLNVNETMKCPKCGLLVVNDGFNWECSNSLCDWEQPGDLV